MNRTNRTADTLTMVHILEISDTNLLKIYKQYSATDYNSVKKTNITDLLNDWLNAEVYVSLTVCYHSPLQMENFIAEVMKENL